MKEKSGILKEQCFMLARSQRSTRRSMSISFLEYELEFGRWSSVCQAKALRFNLVAAEAHQMVFSKEN